MPFDSTSIYGLEVNYLFNEYPITSFGVKLERRIKSSPDLIEGFITDVSGMYDLLNLYDSSSENSIMIDKLVDYRLGNTVVLDDVDFSTINYKLAKLIYIYLDLMVNGNYAELDSATPISGIESVIDNLFEVYVMNEAHKLMKTWKNFTTADVTELRPVRHKFILDTSSVDNGYISISDNVPHSADSIFLYKNGYKQLPASYSYTLDSTSFVLNIDSTGSSGLNVVSGDILVLDSFVSVNPVDPTEILVE